MQQHFTKSVNMKEINNYIFFLISIIVIISCNSPSTNHRYEKFLEANDTVSIQFPDSIPKIINATKRHITDRWLSFITDSDEIALYMYNIHSNEWKKYCLGCIKNYPILYRGPYTITNDSMLIYFHSYKKEILLINYKKNQVVKNTKLDNNIAFSFLDNININLYDSVLRFPSITSQYINENFFLESHIDMEYDLVNDTIKRIFTYPPKLPLTHNHDLELLIPDCIFLKDQVILSFRSIDNIFSFHDTMDRYEIISNTGQNIIGNKSYLFANKDEFERSFFTEFNGLYKDLLYDKENDLFYRIMVTYPDFDDKIPTSKEQFMRTANSRTLTVSVMNSDLQEIACNEIKGVTEFMCFASNGKLYMLEDDKENSDDLERFIGFELTEL